MSELATVRSILKDTLQLGERGARLDEHTPLLGHVPEFDSMAVVAVLTAVEDHYGITIDDGDISAELFATVGSLTRFIEGQLRA